MPRSRSPLHLIAGAALLVGLVVWLWWLDGEAPAEPWLGEQQAEGLVQPPPAAAPAPSSAAPQRFTIDLSLRAGLTLPPPRAAIRIWRGAIHGEPVDAATEWVAGPAAVPWLEPGDMQRSLLRITLPGGTEWYRILRGGGRGAPLDVLLGATATLRGRVVGPDRAPKSGATIWAGGGNAVAGDDGRFAIDVPSGGILPLLAQADGCARRGVEVDVGLGGAELELQLEPEARLQVQLAAPDAGGAPASAVVAPASEAIDTRLLAYPFWFQAIEGGARFDAAGSAEIGGLPRGVSLLVHLQDPARRQARAAPVTTGSGLARVVLPATAPPSLRGRIVGADGAACAGAWLRSAARDAAAVHRVTGDWLLPPAALVRDGAFARSDADGSFTIAGPDAGRAGRLGAYAPGRWVRIVDLPPRALQREGLLWVLPELQAEQTGAPALRFRFQPGQPLELRIRQDGRMLRDWTRWHGDEPYVLSLREPVLVDVVVQRVTPAATEVVLERRALAAAGTIELIVAR
jgi:hypothetical protein